MKNILITVTCIVFVIRAGNIDVCNPATCPFPLKCCSKNKKCTTKEEECYYYEEGTGYYSGFLYTPHNTVSKNYTCEFSMCP